MPSLRFVVICVIPTVLMVGCGGRMLINIRQAKSRVAQQKSAQNPGVATSGAPGSKASGTTDDTRRKTTSIDQMLFLMVLANIIAYIITQIPFSIYTLYYGYETSDNFTFYSLMRAFLLMWSSVYFGIGFYLFCVTSSQFRKQFITKIKSLCICYGQRQARA